MPSFIQSGTFNTGVDKTIVVIDANTGQSVSLGGHVTDLQAHPKQKLVESHPIDTTYSDHRTTFDGWQGTITLDRYNGDGDSRAALDEANYHAKQPQQFYTIMETVRNADRSTDMFQYNQCVLMLEDSGNWRKDSTVPVRWAFHATEKVDLKTGLAVQ